METAQIAKIAVSAAPYSIDKPYDYLIPQELWEKVRPGMRVLVPFGKGNRESEGMILSRNVGKKIPGLKSISALLDEEPVLDDQGIALALWMRQRYFCTVFEAVKTILPAGIWYGFREFWRLADGLSFSQAREKIGEDLSLTEVVDALETNGGSAESAVLRAGCGPEFDTALKALRKAGILTCETKAKRKIQDKNRKMAALAVDAEEALALTEGKKRSAPMRYEVVKFLSTAGKSATADVCYYTGASMATLKSLEKSGILVFSQEETLRIPHAEEALSAPPIVLNEEQKTAFHYMRSLLKSEEASVTLFHGVTGSGKTQVYLRLVQEALKMGKSAMVLVPEIILTPQMMQKFSAYFGAQVAMLHSSLHLSERYDQWKRIRRGEVQVVLGTRSAIFAPLKNLGVIVLDEEQEGSYQSENLPRYHTREIAKYLCAREQAALILGSATPAVETAWAAEKGIYQKTVLRKRYNEKPLPRVLIADMKEEIRSGNAGFISQTLRRELEINLERGEQSILFLNRRGNSRMLLCGECGYVPQCPRCSVALTYHSANGRLMCHYCGHSERINEICPDCGGMMKHVGVGTQKVEEELMQLFPETEILRMDADTVSEGHEKILQKFAQENIPVLVGTQMVAKGLDFENVTLVGVLAADLSLYVDNYHAAERTFHLLAQVVGRAGRGSKEGRAVIQTYTPGNDVIQCAAQQDYHSFYESEIRMRRLRRYPPFADLFVFTISGTEEGRVLRAAAAVRESLKRLAQLPELADSQPEVLGPAPAPVLKVNNRYRYRCTWVGKNDKITRERLGWMMKEFSNDSANRGMNIFVACNTLE